MDSPSKWIRIKETFQLPQYVKEALQKLDDAGHIGYIAGGSVRDHLLKRAAKDFDIATSAQPDELSTLFPEAITVGKAFGVLKIPLKTEMKGVGPEFLEIATFRQDLEYEDHRHPTGVLFSGPSEDAKRRDFTINGLFFDPKTSRILDFVGGYEDLKAGIVRAIGDPMERFGEDALRLLRAVRFTTSLGFLLEAQTAQAIQAHSRLIRKVSAERIQSELSLMWTGKNPHLALQLLSELGLLSWILPEVAALQKVALVQQPDLWSQTLRATEVLSRQEPNRSKVLSWSVVLQDTGKPAAAPRTEAKNFSGHEKEAAQIVLALSERLKMSRSESITLSLMVEEQPKFKDVFQMREATLQRFIRQPHFEELLALHRAVATSSDGNLMPYQFCKALLEDLKNAPPQNEIKLIGGEDLIQLGFRPGPTFSEILKTIEDLALERKLRNKEEALEYVVKHFVS
ncbi:MAG: CCA tRNA nucleotidyltransferase [Methylotenera sp.]|nr:CCA tRNA nucleotidyltransferase [Oligoflexia bacterium]